MKKIIIAAVSAVVVVAGTFGAYKLNERRKEGKATAEVTPVAYMSNFYYGSSPEISGMISSGNIQRIEPENNKLVEEILVEMGDTVTAGTPLIKYDVTALLLDLKKKEANVNVAESDIRTAKRELKKLNALKPSEMLPDPPEPETVPAPEPVTLPAVETKDIIKEAADAHSGNGSAESPFIFYCNNDTIVSGEFFASLKKDSLYATFVVYDGTDPLYQWIVCGTDIITDTPEDRAVNTDIILDQDGSVTVGRTETSFGRYSVPKAEPYEEPPYEEEQPVFDMDYIEDFYENLHKDYQEDYAYTRKQLQKMISQKKEEIERLEIEKKAAELEYKIAQQQNETGAVVARIDGVVTQVGDIENQEIGQPLLVVSGGGGLTVKGYISEMNLDKVTPGTVIDVMSWETGETVQAEVTEVDSIPVSYNSYSWGENPNNSTYEFTALLNELSQIPSDSGVSITLPQQQSQNGFCIPKVYVREEDGKYYVFKAGEDDLLEKQYINAGKIVYGSEIEILGGLTQKDKICFPYGKDIKEGIKTKETDKVLW